MDLLQPCSILWGENRIFEENPKIDLVNNAIYLPFYMAGYWGIYNSDGSIIDIATDFREGNKPSHNQLTNNIAVKVDDIHIIMPETVIYAGFINIHYGHFLINSLPRLWAISKLRTPSMKILCHAACDPAEWFSRPFIASIMHTLGLTANDFITPHHPTIARTIVVPGTSLHEQFAGHRVYGAFCREIADCLMHGRPSAIRKPFAYFSKARLTSAVGLIENEAEIDQALRAKGVEIFYPEQLSLRDQIGVFDDHEYILGSSGSFMHTSIFRKQSRIICMNVTAQINTNFTIVDALAENKVKYFYPPAMQVNASRPGILTSRTLPNATQVAHELLNATRL